MQIRVYYEDTDCGGIVYHSNYLNFCERARSELFFTHEISPHQKESFFVVKSLQAFYHASAVFGDLLDIHTRLLEAKKASLTLEQTIYRDSIVLFTLQIELVYLSDNKPARIPSYLFEFFPTGQN